MPYFFMLIFLNEFHKFLKCKNDIVNICIFTKLNFKI